MIRYHKFMFSHVVILWTKPELPNASDVLIEGANKYLKNIPGILHFHIGKMVPYNGTIVDKSYQVGLNVIFIDKQARDTYEKHPSHIEFIERVFKPNGDKILIYDFQ